MITTTDRRLDINLTFHNNSKYNQAINQQRSFYVNNIKAKRTQSHGVGCFATCQMPISIEHVYLNTANACNILCKEDQCHYYVSIMMMMMMMHALGFHIVFYH